MTKIVKNIPLMDLASYLIESPEHPTHVGGVQIFEPVNGTSAEIVERVVRDYKASPVAPPFNYIPVFPSVGLPKWGEVEALDPDYHVRRAGLPSPGTLKQLIDLVVDLHEGMLDRSRPGWIAYLIEGMEGDRFALYWKVHHAYIDGASALMRMDKAMSRTPDELEARPVWAPFFDPVTPVGDDALLNPIGETLAGINTQAGAFTEVGFVLFKTLMRSRGLMREGAAPLPFSAPHTMFNQPVHATRRLAVGSLPLDDFKAVARKTVVTINDIALTMVGAALERYAEDHGALMDKPLVAACPMGIRKEGDTDASTQIAAISVKLGEPHVDIVERLAQVHESAMAAKQDARNMSREGLINYLAVIAGLSELMDRSPFSGNIPPLTNVNVSNVAGPTETYYLSGAKMLHNYPVSTLAGGTVINITFISLPGVMDYAIITDAKALPDPERIADYMAEAFRALAGKVLTEAAAG